MILFGGFMKYGALSATAIAQEIGLRLKQARLNADITQTDLASRSGLSRKAVQNAEKGQGHLTTYIALLSGLDLVDQLDLFLPKQEISPLQLAKMQGKKRQRASRQPPKNLTDKSW